MKLAVFALMALMLAGCASEDIRTLQGKGAKRTFRYEYEEVYAAAQRAVARRKLEVLEDNREAGRLIVKSGTSLTSLGENIGIFVTRLNPRSTSVEVIAKPLVSTITFPPDWPLLVFGDVEQELTAVRPAR